MFPAAVSGANKTRIRTSGYWSRTACCISPNEVIFRAQVAEDLTDPFIEFEYDNIDIGDDTVPLTGLVCYLSPTTDIRDAVYRGRVPRAPTSSTFYIDLNSTIVPDGTYVLVVADSDYFAKVRQADLEDGFIPWHNLEPMLGELPGCVVLYDSDNDGLVSFAPAQTGIAIADGATISSWLWAIRGGGATSFTSGSSTSQHPVIQLAAGYKYMIQCNVTDSNGVLHYQWVHLYAVTRYFDAPVILPAVTGQIANDLDNGFTASITAYAQVNTLVNRSHVAVFKVERFGDNSSTPVLTNLRFSGRLRSESITTEGSAEAGRLQQVSFAAEGLTTYLQGLRCPNDIIRNNASPAAFGEIKNPTVYRMLVYFLSLYTTFLNNGSFTAGNDNTLAWMVGGEPLSMDGGYALDVMKSVCDKIRAAPNYSPDGSIRIEQLASYTQDRSGIVTIVDFTLSDMRSYQIDIDTSRQVGQVVAYGGVWQTVNNTFIGYTSNAPTVPYSDAPETGEINRELLTTDATTTEADDELASRAGNHYAFSNPKPLLRLVMIDSWNFLFATGYQRYTATIPASTNTRGIAYTTTDKWQLQSVNLTINPDGTDDTNFELVKETSNDDAQSIASQLPINLSDLNPVLPVLSDDPAFPDEPTWAYPTDTPTDDELQPIDPYSGYLSYSPFTPDQAAQAAQQQGTTNCKAFQVLMRNSGTTNSPFLTTILDAYTLKITGFGRLSTDAWLYVFPDDDPFYAGWTFPNIGGSISHISGGQVIGAADTALDATFVCIEQSIDAHVKSVVFRIQWTSVPPVAGSQEAHVEIDGSPVASETIPATAGGIQSVTWHGDLTGPHTYRLIAGIQGAGAGYTLVGTRVTFGGEGTNPFTGDPGGDSSGDFFYHWLGEDGVAELFGDTEGGLIDGGKVDPIPPYSPSHEYLVPFTGSGNAIQAAYALADYTDVQNRAFVIQVCKNS